MKQRHDEIPFEIVSETSETTINSNLIIENDENCHDNVQFPMTQLPLPQSSNNTVADHSKIDLLKQAELSRRVFLYLIEKYNLSPSIILHSLYLHSGNVEACEAYLSDPTQTTPWTLEDDHLILTDAEVGGIIQQKGLEALRERRTFLHQVCEEAIGNWSEIATKLK